LDAQFAVAEVKAMPDRLPISEAEKVEVFVRDGWICCWCKKPVIFPPAMKMLVLEVEATGRRGRAYYHPRWTRADAPLVDELGAVVDHIKAHSSGGLDERKNLATACNRCNIRKSAGDAAVWEQRPKPKPVKGKYGEPQDWDGLSGVFMVLAAKFPSKLSATDKR
jgi:HNH endonuclease